MSQRKMKQLKRLTRRDVINGTGTVYDGSYVRELIKRKPGAILYLYYFFDNVSFADTILKEVQVTMKYRIPKPGRNREMFFEIKNRGFCVRKNFDNRCEK